MGSGGFEKVLIGTLGPRETFLRGRRGERRRTAFWRAAQNTLGADVDIFWTKIAKSRQHIPYEDFLQLVDLIAERKGVDREELDFYIVENAKPKMTGTRGAEAFSFCKYDEQKAAEKKTRLEAEEVLGIA
jgi:hypothetical protein